MLSVELQRAGGSAKVKTFFKNEPTCPNKTPYIRKIRRKNIGHPKETDPATVNLSTHLIYIPEKNILLLLYYLPKGLPLYPDKSSHFSLQFSLL